MDEVLKSLDEDGVVTLCQELVKIPSPIGDEKKVAEFIADTMKKIGLADVQLVEGDPGAARPVLERWSTDDNFWLRRASMLAQLPALRAGDGAFALFASFADRMVGEREFFIRKAIGWVLRDVSKKRPELVYGFLSENIHELSGLTLREGSKYLPADQREALRELRRSQKPSD